MGTGARDVVAATIRTPTLGSSAPALTREPAQTAAQDAPATTSTPAPALGWAVLGAAALGVAGIAALARGRGAAPATGTTTAAALHDAAAGTALLRTTPPEQLARVERTLREGTPVPGSFAPHATWSHRYGTARVDLVDPDDPEFVLPAVLKGHEGAQEAFGYRMSQALGIDYLVPKAARREDGLVALEFFDGFHLDTAGIEDGHQLRAAIQRRYEMQHGLEPAQAARLAQVDHELLMFFDWLTANRDRKPSNTMITSADGDAKFIDQGGVLRGELRDPLRPRLKDAFYVTDPEHPNRIQLSEFTRLHIRATLSDDELREVHAVLREPYPEPPTAHKQLTLARARSERQLQRLLQRRDAALERGYVEYQPVTLESRRRESWMHTLQLRTGTYSTWGEAVPAEVRRAARDTGAYAGR